jgi:hypothetical protein
MLIKIASSVRLIVRMKEFEKHLKDCEKILTWRTYTKIYRLIPVSVKVRCKITGILHEEPRRVTARISRETRYKFIGANFRRTKAVDIIRAFHVRHNLRFSV